MAQEIAGADVSGGEYRPPPTHHCGLVNYQMPLTPIDRIAVALRTYKTRVVHFSVELQRMVGDDWTPVARIDTNRTVHLHLWRHDGLVLVDHQLIRALPPSPEGQGVVHNEFDSALTQIATHWESYLRRWHG